MRLKIVPAFLFPVLFLAACDGKPVVERRFGTNENPNDAPVLQAADLVGYDGTNLRRKAAALKEASAKRNQALENAR